MSYKIALLIPSTSKGRPQWKSMKDSYLYNLTTKTFLQTFNNEHQYTFYIGIDDDDRIYSNITEQEELKRFSLIFKNIQFKFISMTGIKKGHLTVMWNRLFKKAYDDGYDYFYQTGDDINFKTKNWVNDSINVLKRNNNIGLTGPWNNNGRILTQAMVSRKHMEIFGWFFPKEILNWCCDDWYNLVYQPDYFFPLNNHFCSNDGGAERYIIDNNPNFKDRLMVMKNLEILREKTRKIANTHKILLQKYIHNNREI